MVEERDTVNLVPLPTIDENQRHPQAILQTFPSIISADSSNNPRNSIDIFDEIYSNRAHRKCLDISYLTLLSMTSSIIFWIFYWLTYNRCENVEDPEINSFLCDLVDILETLIFVSLGIIPVLFALMIYLWINYSCYNSIDLIRKNYKELKIEGDQWQEQLNYYYTKKKWKYFNCFRRKQRKELYERGFGYIILSSHGILIDELILLSKKKNPVTHASLQNNNKLLKLTFKKTCTKPWTTHLSIYLPENPINQSDLEQLHRLFPIETNPSTSV